MSLRNMRAWLFWIVALSVAAGCGDEPRPTAPSRALQGIRPGIPQATTECNSAPCLCAEYPSGYEASVQAYHPSDYAGDGTRFITIHAPGPALVHVWPATACGDSMATYSLRIGCPICLNLSRDTEPEMLNRTYSIWPSAVAHDIVFHPRTGLDYWVYQDNRQPVYLSATATTIQIP